MNDIVTMKILNYLDYLSHNCTGFAFREHLLLGDFFVKFPTAHVLHHNINLLFISEEILEVDNIRMLRNSGHDIDFVKNVAVLFDFDDFNGVVLFGLFVCAAETFSVSTHTAWLVEIVFLKIIGFIRLEIFRDFETYRCGIFSDQRYGDL